MAEYKPVPNIVEFTGEAEKSPTYGCPEAKPLVNWIDLLALVSSLSCLAVCCTIVGHSSFSWRIGFTHQLVIIGFLLSSMNLCNRRLARNFFLISEIRRGSMTLQNIDAILQQSVFVSDSSLLWRIVIFTIAALPIGLGVAYKTFTGGHASQIVAGYSAVHYGAFNRPMENNDLQAIAMVDAMTAMKHTADDDTKYPKDFDQSAILGHNLAIVSDNEVVMVDMPNDTALGEIQGKLALDEYIYLSADIWGTLARYNFSIVEDDDLWDMDSSRTTTMETYRTRRIAIARGLAPNMWAVVGAYNKSRLETVFSTYESPNEDTVRDFRKSDFAFGFNIYRLPCSVMWNLTLTSIELMLADCEIDKSRHVNGTTVNKWPNSDLEEKVLDVIDFAIGSFNDNREDSPWRLPSAAMAAVTVWSGRWKHMMPTWGNKTGPSYAPGFLAKFHYKAKNEKFELVRQVIRQSPLLYMILAVQPLLSIIMFGMAICLYSTPITPSFGLITILASIKPSSLKHLSGAGLSGTLKQRMFLTMSVEERFGATHNGDPVSGKIQTELKIDSSTAEDSSSAVPRIQRGIKYM